MSTYGGALLWVFHHPDLKVARRRRPRSVPRGACGRTAFSSDTGVAFDMREELDHFVVGKTGTRARRALPACARRPGAHVSSSRRVDPGGPFVKSSTRWAAPCAAYRSATIGWSRDLLRPDERKLFRRLAGSPMDGL